MPEDFFFYSMFDFLCRAFTAVELKKKLHGKKVSHGIADAVINDFQIRCVIFFLYRRSGA